MGSFFQYGSAIHFIQGVYEGLLTVDALQNKGDTGLGTFNGVDGEMIVLDGEVFHINEKGFATKAKRETKTPFAAVAFLDNVVELDLKNVLSIERVNHELDRNLKTTNVFFMFKIEGLFNKVHLRSEACQSRPYRPLSETLPSLQYEFTLEHVEGTMVATRCPDYSKGCTIQGYHYHFLDKEKRQGGHVFDFSLNQANVFYQVYRHFEMELPNTDLFDQAQIHIDMDNALKKIE